MLVVALVALALALLLVVLAFTRIARNAGLLDLEDYARRSGCVYAPISTTLVGDLSEWSKPLQLRVSSHQHPLLVELELKPVET